MAFNVWSCRIGTRVVLQPVELADCLCEKWFDAKSEARVTVLSGNTNMGGVRSTLCTPLCYRTVNMWRNKPCHDTVQGAVRHPGPRICVRLYTLLYYQPAETSVLVHGLTKFTGPGQKGIGISNHFLQCRNVERWGKGQDEWVWIRNANDALARQDAYSEGWFECHVSVAGMIAIKRFECDMPELNSDCWGWDRRLAYRFQSQC